MIGLEHLSFKLEGYLPTGSWLDRGAARIVDDAAGTRGLVTVGPDALGPALALQAARAGLPLMVLIPADAPTTPDLHWSVALGARLTRVATDEPTLRAALSEIAAAAGFTAVDRNDVRLREGVVAVAGQARAQADGAPLEAIVVASLLGPEGVWLEQATVISGIASGHLLGDDAPTASDADRHAVVTVTLREADAARRLLAREEGIIASRRGVAGLAALIRARRQGWLPKARSAVALLANEIGGTADGPPLALDEAPVGEPVAFEALCADLRGATLRRPGPEPA